MEQPELGKQRNHINWLWCHHHQVLLFLIRFQIKTDAYKITEQRSIKTIRKIESLKLAYKIAHEIQKIPTLLENPLQFTSIGVSQSNYTKL